MEDTFIYPGKGGGDKEREREVCIEYGEASVQMWR